MPAIATVVLLAAAGVASHQFPHPVNSAGMLPPTLASPPNGVRLDTFGPVLSWAPPEDTARFHLQVTPAGNDGPGIDLIGAGSDSQFPIPAPPVWFGLLPDMTYAGRVRTSPLADDGGDAGDAWSAWTEARTFRTPTATTSSITLQAPSSAGATGSLTPVLEWRDSNPNVWLYEVEVSESPLFDASAALYWETRHVGTASPPRSYTIPATAPLRPATLYHWRVRPRVQGDGLPVAWTATASFRTPERWRPAPRTSWQIQLQGTIDLSVQADVWDVDLFDTPQAVIDSLHARGAKVICYLSAGSWEDWRSDAARFPAVVLGKGNGWPGERWLDIRRLDLLDPILEQRLDLCQRKGFDGVDFDNMDGFANDTGFPLTAADQLAFNRYLAQAAHTRGLAAGLKNDLEQAHQLEPYFDWLLLEECFEQGLCHLSAPFTAAGKAVLAIEYGLPLEAFCDHARRSGISAIRKRLSLNAWRETCS